MLNRDFTYRDLVEMLSELDEECLDFPISIMMDDRFLSILYVDIAEDHYVQINDVDKSLINAVDYHAMDNYNRFDVLRKMPKGTLMMIVARNGYKENT